MYGLRQNRSFIGVFRNCRRVDLPAGIRSGIHPQIIKLITLLPALLLRNVSITGLRIGVTAAHRSCCPSSNRTADTVRCSNWMRSVSSNRQEQSPPIGRRPGHSSTNRPIMPNPDSLAFARNSCHGIDLFVCLSVCTGALTDDVMFLSPFCRAGDVFALSLFSRLPETKMLLQLSGLMFSE